MTRRLALSALILVVFAGTACGRYLTTGVAVVNGVGISKGELDKQVGVVLSSQQFQGQVDPRDAEQRLDIERQVIVQLIQRELIRQEADRLAVRVPPAEVNQRFEQVRAQFPDEGQFRQALAQNSLTVASLREQIREQLQLERVQSRAIGNLTATDDEIKAAYGNGSRFDEMHVRHILFRVSGTDAAAARKKADEALARLRNGADFIELAKRVSEDETTKAQGGDLGTITRQTPFDQGFLSAAFALKKGQISGVVQTQFGFHIIKAEDRRSKALEQARSQLTQEIITSKQQEAFTDFMRERVDEARIVVNPRYGDFNPSTLSIDAHQFFVPPEPEPETQPFPSR